MIHYMDTDGRYLCNKACGVTQSKLTLIASKITCKNCLRKIKTTHKYLLYVRPEKVVFT